MPYIGRAATNAGSVNYLDDISSGFDGSDVTFTCAVNSTTITPGQENVYIYLDGVFQHPGESYTISGSTITFTEAPVSGVDFTAYVAGEGAYLDDGTVSTAKLDDDAVTASKLDDDGTGFQVGDLGVGGSLTSGDKLTVTGRLRASGGIIGNVTGDLTGNVTGNLTGNVTGNTSGSAATVTGATQSAITSVGTLTSLNVSGNAVISGTLQSDDFTLDAGSGNPDLVIKTSASSSATAQMLFLTGNKDFTLINDTDNFRLYNSTPGIGVDVFKVIGSSSDILFGDVGNSRHVSLDYSNGDFVVNKRLGVGAVPDSSYAGATIYGTSAIKTTPGDGSELRFKLYTGGAADASILQMFKADGSTIGINLNTGGDTYFTGGRVLVGTSTAYRTNERLQIAGSEGIASKATTNGGGAFVAVEDSGNTSGSAFVNVDTGGNVNFKVGVGGYTTITGGTSATPLTLFRGNSGTVAQFGCTTVSDDADIYLRTNGIFNFRTAGSGQIRFSSGGSQALNLDASQNANFSGSIQGKTDAHLSYTTGQAIDTVSGGAFLAEGSDVIAGRFFFQGYNADGGKLVGFNNESDQLVMYNYGDGNYMSKIKYNGDVDFIRNFHGGANRVTNPWDASGSTNYGSLYFQKGSASLGQTFATATNVAVGGGYANWYSNIINASLTSHRHVQWMNNGTSAGTITYNSSNSVAYNTSGSDKSLKKNFANWTENVLDSFDKINPQLFHFKIQDGKEDKHKGFIAQEMIDKFPEAYPLVAYGEGDNQTKKYQFNPSGMVVYLMKAVKELSDKIKVLEAK